ncbi:hypothetical protein OPKNFCMD_6660 [Methylobacterium crusticola]|uniref:Uncharacterized protein n=1 Tax=Methylobacterium crusticola TaxID=1697972 RepID=A0ABQ4R836_9HYPH|nr:hypothetical protein [Methylobacterium crusticola]GJD53881.1 hypothetical protein OPKNFCMD_6660 [Methylobacterium crusticola]
MSSHRPLSWSAAMHELAADRLPSTGAERRAMAAQRAFAAAAEIKVRREARTTPLIVAGRYDRKAIMVAAIAAAKARRAITNEAWGVCLSAALKGTWQVAKAARRAQAH